MRCHLIVDAKNVAHKPATLLPGILTVCPLATLPTLHCTELLPLLLLEYNSEQFRQGVVPLFSLVFLFFFDVLLAFGCPLFFKLLELGCGQVTSFPLASSAVLYGLPVMMQVFPLFVAFRTVAWLVLHILCAAPAGVSVACLATQT